MSQLSLPSTLDIFTAVPDETARPFVMQRRNSSSDAAAIFEFTPIIIPRPEDATDTYHIAEPTEWYKRKTNKAVFRTQLLRDSASKPAQDVVCKIRPVLSPEDFSDDGLSSLQQEALIYQEKLTDLQGICVPRFIGLFGWAAPNGVRGFESYRSRILDALLAIHRAGVRHHDLESLPNNVLIKDTGDVFLIDFEESTEHQCKLSKDYQFQFYTPTPSIQECPCIELMNVAQQLDVWFLPTYALWGGYMAPTVEILKGRKSLINYLQNQYDGLAKEDLEYGANKAIESLQGWIDRRKPYDENVPLSIASE
ncbi:hypothetical protein C8Q79DRAFT_1012530 [Trametes meyenii]|nr:hypothetical protein C8Q79DRAFT_1012530 [Trametes meyenii]